VEGATGTSENRTIFQRSLKVLRIIAKNRGVVSCRVCLEALCLKNQNTEEGKNVCTADIYQHIIFLSFMRSSHEMHNGEVEYLTLRKYKGFEEPEKFMSRTKEPKY
jgi:hypothetical protein